MLNTFQIQTTRSSFSKFGLVLCGLALFGLSACQERDFEDGIIINGLILPTDTLLNLACADAGINSETCILSDPENPFMNVVINEFNVNDPDAETKFDLASRIPAGPSGAKARFYLWATALARRASGENQWYTARALHELYNSNEDPLIQAQALKAYRSVLDNFFSSVTFFECCANVDPNGNPVPFSITLNELVADDLYRSGATGYTRLVEGDPLLVLSLLSEWGYTYQPATPPNFDNGVLAVNDG